MQKMLDIPYHLFFSVGEFVSDDAVNQLRDSLEQEHPGALQQMRRILSATLDAPSDESLLLEACAHRGIALAIQRAFWMGYALEGFTDLLGREWEPCTDEALGETLCLGKGASLAAERASRKTHLGQPETPSAQTLAFLTGFFDTSSQLYCQAHSLGLKFTFATCVQG